MNERIRQLDKAAQEYAGRICGNDEDSNWNEWLNVYKETFAELIVRECADIINHRADTCSDWLDSVKANEAVREGQRECAKTIKEHFGVEE
jgi:hypothetical protein